VLAAEAVTEAALPEAGVSGEEVPGAEGHQAPVPVPALVEVHSVTADARVAGGRRAVAGETSRNSKHKS
jgi:hypothetical protein